MVSYTCSYPTTRRNPPMDTARMTTRCSSRVALWHRYTILYLLCSAVRSTAIDISNALLTRVLRDSYRDNRLNKAHSPLPFGLGIGVGYLQEQRSHRCSRHSTTTMRPFTACISTPFQAAGSSGRACRPSSLPSGRILRHAVHRCAAAEGTETNTAPSVMEWDIVMFSASINAGTHRLGRVSRIESNGMLEVEPMIEQVIFCFNSHILQARHNDY